MKLLRYTVIAAAGFALAGCAGLMAPSANDMAQVPVVRFGDAGPADKEFVRFYPAGVPLPVVAAVEGTLLDQTAKTTLQVTLKRDVYAYRRWVSFDGKTWLPSEQVVDSRFEIRIPGARDGRNPGSLHAEFNLK